MTWSEAVRGLVDDASTLPPREDPIHDATARFGRRDHPEQGALVLRDTDLPLVRGFDGPLAVVVTGGAGQIAGPAGLCTRLGLRLGRIEVTLRDLDDLPGNARRVVAAVDAARDEGALGEEVAVHVGVPSGATFGAAADEVAAAGLGLAVAADDDLLVSIDAALDRETPFTCRGPVHAAYDGERPGALGVLVATGLLFDGLPGAGEALVEGDPRALLETGADLGRARRWLRGCASPDADTMISELRAL